MAIKSNISKWANDESKKLERSESVIANMILNRSRMLAPKLTGALREDGRVENISTGGKRVKFGGDKVPYARRRHFENQKNPQTLNYLEKAGNSIAKEDIRKLVKL